MRRLFLAVLLLANLASLALYLHDWYPALREQVARVEPVDRGLDEAKSRLREHGATPAHALAASTGIVLAIGWAAWLTRRRSKGGRSSGGTLLGVLAFVALAGGFGWLAYTDEETIPLGPIVIHRGPRESFLAFGLHVLLLVTSAHVILLLVWAYVATGGKKGKGNARGGKPKPKPPAKK